MPEPDRDALEWLDRRRQALARLLRRLWSLWPLVALVFSVALGFLVVWVQSWTPLDSTALSLILGFGAGFAVFVQRSAVERRQHTIDLLKTLSDSQVLAPASAWMAERIAAGETVVVTDLDDEERAKVVNLLDYYQFLCVLAEEEIVDRKVLLDLRGGSMRSALRLCDGYIRQRREDTGNRDLYVAMERLLRSGTPEQSDLLEAP